MRRLKHPNKRHEQFWERAEGFALMGTHDLIAVDREKLSFPIREVFVKDCLDGCIWL